HTSDLYWRVTMLLHSPGFVERHPPRLWTWGVAGGLLSLAALVAGVGLRADAAPPGDAFQREAGTQEGPRKEEPAKNRVAPGDEPKREADNDIPGLEDFLKTLRAGIDPEQMKQIREQVRRAIEMSRRPGGGGAFGGPAVGWARGADFNPFGE